MTPDEFETQIDRLKGEFGKSSFSVERCKLIYQAIKSLPGFWLERATNDFIANSRRAPVLKDFLEKVSEYEEQKKEDGYRTGLSGADITGTLSNLSKRAPNKEFARFCAEAVTRKMRGEITEAQWQKEVLPMIDETAARLMRTDKALRCNECGDIGYVLEEDVKGYRNLYRCNCEIGMRKPVSGFTAPKTDGTREEVFIPVFT